LVEQIRINCNQHLKSSFREAQEFTVLFSSPTNLLPELSSIRGRELSGAF
jgi:hypothetical protein